MPDLNRVALFTNEYPPHVYGGAGVHVEYLSRELARLVPVEVRCFGDRTCDEPSTCASRAMAGWSEAKQNTDPRFGGALGCLLPQSGDGQRQPGRGRGALPYLVH